MIATEKAPMKRLILVSVLLVILPVLATAPASNAPTIQVEETAETAKPSGRVLKKGNKSENRSDSEARNPAILTSNGVFQHPARRSRGSR